MQGHEYEEQQNLKDQCIETSADGRYNRLNDELYTQAYKSVYRANDSESGLEVAWNDIYISSIPIKDRQKVYQMGDIIKNLQHPHIINTQFTLVNKDKAKLQRITDLFSAQSLRMHFRKIQSLKLKIIKGWGKQILEGLHYLHCQNDPPIIYRELCCNNIFINSINGEIKLGALGLATTEQNFFHLKMPFSLEYMAPEMLEDHYDTAIDIFAFGMAMLEIITQEIPYKEESNPAQILLRIHQGILPKALLRIPEGSIKEFILKCLAPRKQRYTAQQLLNDSFLNEDTPENQQSITLIEQIEEIEQIKFQKETLESEVQTEEIRHAGIVIKEQDTEHLIQFDFNVLTDTPQGVAEEILEAQQLDQSVLPKIINAIEYIIHEQKNAAIIELNE